MLFLSTKEEYARQGITNGMFGVIVAKDEVLSAEHKDRYEETTYWKVKFETDSGEKIVSVYFNHMLPIRDDELDAYKQKIASELKKGRCNKRRVDMQKPQGERLCGFFRV